uniref:Alpha-galactosidase n=1 Tax=Rhipicephalus pulchellus TaxID=72859 RepID=L7LX80_RHIPC
MGPTAAVTGATTATQSSPRWSSMRIALLLLFGVQPALCLENGLARTPPMGWMAWERFLCNIDCADDPENCVSERLFKEMGDAVVRQGYRKVGYQYVNIDDCWMANQRDASGRLQANRTRFPNDIKHLADFMHARGLKLGIYGDVGTKTCEKYPGSKNHLLLDAQTFAEWDVDMVKMDGCFANMTEFKTLYPDFGNAINKTGRSMVYSCSWPAYLPSNVTPNYSLIGHHCNMWRNYVDIADSWRSVESIIDYYAKNQDALVAAASPGRWNDPDMLVIGNFGLSYDQSRAQMALWAIMAAPLFMSHDLRHTRREFRKILQNRAIIAVNQDPLGIMGKRIKKEKGVETWARPVTPVVGKSSYSYALVFFNRNDMGNTRKHVTQLRTLGLKHPYGYRVTDLFENRYLGLHYPDSFLKVRVNPSGGVVMVKAEAVRCAPPACPKPHPKYPPRQPRNVSTPSTEKGMGTPPNGVVLMSPEPVKAQVSPVPATPSATVANQGEVPDSATAVGNAGLTGTAAQPSLV